MTPRSVLVVNCGSSSMKYQLVDPVAGVAVATGVVERIGEGATGRARHTERRAPVTRGDLAGDPAGDPGGAEQQFTGDIPDHAAALTVMRRLFDDADRPLRAADLAGIGHRVVHGGDVFSDPVLIDDAVLAQVRAVSVRAPLHNPANLTGIEAAGRAFPGVPQVAVFDTAFFRTLPPAAAQYAIDAELAARWSIRRYGFHGTSHQWVSGRVAEELGRPLASLDQIVLHLGNGASASAVRGGVAVETSMGLTPLEGLVMGTRSGDLDPGVLLYLADRAGLSVADLDALLNRRSGLRGLAGSNDFRDLQAMIDGPDPDRAAAARLAVDVFCHRVRKYVGAYLAVLGGVDVITFTAGVGEHVPSVRAQVLAGLERLGISVDPERNTATDRGARVISPPDAPVTVMVVPTDEELAIARATAALVDPGQPSA